MTEDYTWEDFPDWIASVKKGDSIQIWSDGGCQPNPGPGGWGAILQKGKSRTILTGGGSPTTNNRMEMLAALSSIDCLPHGCKITLYSDSQYVCKGIALWMYTWHRNRWKKKDGSDVTNADLWKEIRECVRRHIVRTEWVRGHNGHFENEFCDHLATQSRIIVSDEERKTKYTKAKFKQIKKGTT